MTVLRAEGVTIRRGGRAILDGITLEGRGGMLLALIGPNGAGKSTLMSVIAGLLSPDGGKVTLDGAPLPAMGRRALAEARAYLPQNPRAEWPLSVERLVALGLTPRLPAFGRLPAAMEARVAEAIMQFDMSEQAQQPVTTLSGGELARVMLARAVVGDPRIVMADEPLAGLDPRHALESAARLRALADSGKLVITALQELTIAARFATHLGVMREGRLVAFGTTGETLSSTLLREVFEVEACVTAPGTPTAVVDFVVAQPAASVVTRGGA
ncbi:conserved hypothetical protein [Altererythrobacter sp. B11]|uniref:ABC transporter ATP-binding protein n=1 Tax=Altererythrobacter sp. B11 TaxID=2060312 RepID=UPI000DC72E59|nr:ABC transporter ATP-binding protein [Altererythrobacter sp. B11]BBC72054.1 conserved hypothetical protein [Altererythrobacter sp. B11]